MEEKSKGKKILEILQENYKIKSAQDLSSVIKDLFKDSLQEMMNQSLKQVWVIKNMIKNAKKQITEMVPRKRNQKVNLENLDCQHFIRQFL